MQPSYHDHLDAISNALKQRPVRLPHRATFDHISPEMFANNRQLDRLNNNNWQIIFGRRGAGKTTLLANYASYISNSARDRRIASIEVNATDFKADLTQYRRQLTDRQIAQIYFGDFMARIGAHLIGVFNNANTRSKFYRALLELGDSKRKRVEDLVVKLHTCVTTPTVEPIAAKRSATSVLKRDNRRKRGGRADLDVSAKVADDGGDLHASMGAGLNASASNEISEHSQATTRDAIFKLEYFKAREALVELLDELHLEKLFLIIDEWSELDRSATTSIQAHFAELLKLVFWNQPRFVVKIGAIRKQTRLISSSKKDGPIGLELSADIFDIDLDQVYCSDEIIIDQFFEDLLFRHLVFCDERLKVFIDRNHTAPFFDTTYFRPIETFLGYIFKRPEDFRTLIRGAGGLPRDFLEIMDDLAESKNYSVREAWGGADVRKMVTSHCVKKKLNNLPDSPHILNLHETLVDMVSRNHSRTILVPKKAAREIRDSIAEFYHHRLIHDVRSSEIPAPLRQRYDLYNVDLGIVYDATKERLDGFSEGDGCHLPLVDKKENLIPFIIDGG